MQTSAYVVTWWLQVVMVVTLFDSKGLSGAMTETKDLAEQAGK